MINFDDNKYTRENITILIASMYNSQGKVFKVFKNYNIDCRQIADIYFDLHQVYMDINVMYDGKISDKTFSKSLKIENDLIDMYDVYKVIQYNSNLLLDTLSNLINHLWDINEFLKNYMEFNCESN